MKRKINIIVISLIFAISSSIGLDRVKGEKTCDPNDPVCSGGGGISTEIVTAELASCKSSYQYCLLSLSDASRFYYVIEVYDIQNKNKMYYYDFNYGKGVGQVTSAILSDLSFTPHAYGNNVNNAEQIDLKILLGSDFKRENPEDYWWKWDNYVKNFAISNDGTATDSAGSEINDTEFNKWLYLKEEKGGRVGGKYDCLKESDCNNSATAALKSAGSNGLYVVRISAGILISKMEKNYPGNQIHMEHYVATDRLFNTEGPINTDVFDMNGFIEPLKLYTHRDANSGNKAYNSDINKRYEICTDGSSVQALCSYWADKNSGFLDNAYWFTDGGNKVEQVDPCETLCKKSEKKNFWENAELPNGMTTEEACVSCCDSNTGQINLDLNSCKYKPNECSYTPPSPNAKPNNSDLSCTSVNNLDFKVQVGNYDDGCSKIPIYNSFSGVINVSDKRTFYDGTLAKLLVAGKGFNWDLSFQGSINYQQSIPKQEYLDSYNTYIQCLKLKVNANVATDNERAALDTYTQCYNNLSSYNPTTLQSGNIDVSSIFDISTKQMNINAYGSQPARTQIANQYDAIYKNSGDPFNTHTVVTNKDFVYTNTEFFIPITVQNGTKGKLIAQVNSKILQMTDKQIECPIVISSYVECQDDDNCLDDDDDCDDPNDPNCHFFQCDDPNGCTTGLNLIYRPISLKEPFPNRTAGYNWQGMYNNNKYEELFITNSRGASDNEIYQEEPMYVITLTPTDIKEIREYNKSHSYNDFNLTCDEYGLYCKSEFIKDYSNLFKSGTCGLVGDWYACYTQNQKVAVEEILAPMKW